MQGREKTPRSIPPVGQTVRMGTAPPASSPAPSSPAPLSSPSPLSSPAPLSAPSPPVVVGVRPPPNVKAGVVVGDKYRIEGEIGRGGFGVVVKAMHLQLDQRVAIKVLTEGEGSTPQEWAEDSARFRREAKATAALRSEHVVRVLDVDVMDSGYPYIVMEYLEGKTFHELIYGAPVPLPITDAVDYVLQVLAALADAHAYGIVHRDLKPANVLITSGLSGMPIVKVLDFGVSKMVNAASQQLTRTGSVVGTVAYMAPEQMMDARSVDGRGDLWSAGLVLYEALARSHPFGPATSGPQVITAVLKSAVPSLRAVRPDVPPALEAAILKLLEKTPARRFTTVAEVALALAPFASLRSRPVLDEIERAPPPRGAAAVQPPPSQRELQPASQRSPRPPPAAPQKSSAALRVFLAFVTATFTLGAISLIVFWIKPRSARRMPPPRPTISLSVSAPSASAGAPPR